MAQRDKTKRKQFGTTLRNARIASGMSREDVAKRIGVTRQAIYLWEVGRSWPGANYYFKLHQLYRLGDTVAGASNDADTESNAASKATPDVTAA